MEIEYVIVSTMLGFVGGSLATVFYIVWNQTINRKKAAMPNGQLVCLKCRNKKLVPMGNDANKLICPKCFTVVEKKTEMPTQTTVTAPTMVNASTMIAQPTATTQTIFACKNCTKTFDALWKLKKHVGMSHSDLIEV